MKYNKGKEVDADMCKYIAQNFSYDYETGIITRKDRANSSGSLDKDGYLIIKIKTNQIKAHRLAWFLYYGSFPKMEIDHINRNRLDNRICNLREADRKLNAANIKKYINPITGAVGVYFDKTRGLKKNFSTKYKNKIFRFYTLDEALQFRKEHNLVIS